MAFLIFIAASGLILNHADDIGLSQRAAAPWLLRLYGVKLPPVDSAFSAGGVIFATSSETLYANGKELAKNTGRLIGAVARGDTRIVATRLELFLINSEGALIERFAPDAPRPMYSLGSSGDHIVVKVQQELYEFDPDSMSLSAYSPLASNDVTWSLPTTPSRDQAEQIGAAGLGQALNWERVLLDFHSGRILPEAGRYIADITALCLLYMCFTGILLWARKR